MAMKEFEAIFKHIGGFGLYQWIQLGVANIISMFLAFVYFSQIFMTLTPPHWCRAPPELEDLNITDHDLKLITVPLKDNGREFQSCLRYDVNYTEVLANGSMRVDPSWPTTTCTYGWNYNYSLYYPTITSEMNWVCDQDWRPTLAQSIFFVGSLVGSPFFGWAADRWGRLPIIIATNLIGAIAGIASAFSTSFAMFSIFRFIVGTIYEQHAIIAYILVVEYVSTNYRTIMMNVPIMIFLTLAMCIMPWLALWVAHWTYFAIIIHGTQFIAISFYWLLPESARWLIGKGQIDDTIAIVKRVAKVNRKTLSKETVEDFKEYCEKQHQSQQKSATVFDLFKTPILRRRYLILCFMWVVMTMAYDGSMRNTEHIGSNAFTSFTIAGALEFPADLIMMIGVEKLGRRHTLVWSFVLNGLVSIAIAGFSEENEFAVLILALMGRFFITVTMNTGHQYPMEVIPTVARGQGMGFMQTVGFLSAFTSPYIVYLGKFGHYIPYMILGSMTVIGGLVCMYLPETLNESLPDSLEDGETFFINQNLCFNPCSRKKDEESKDTKAGQVNTTEGVIKGHHNPAYESTNF